MKEPYKIAISLTNFLGLTSVILSLCLSLPADAKPKGGGGFTSVFNVKNAPYNATGNGTTDDSTAIYNAIQDANQHPGSTVLFPAGTYNIGSAHPYLNPTSITLSGQSHAALNFSGTGNGYINLLGTGGGVNGLTINNTGSSSNEGIYVEYANNYSVSSNTFNGWNDSVFLYYTATGSVSGNTFNVPASEYGVYPYYANTTNIDNNVFNAVSSGSGYGIYDYYYSTTVEASGNAFNNLYEGIHAYNNNYTGTITATSNTFSNCYYGLYAEYLGQVTFNSNTCTNCSYGAYDYYNLQSMYKGNTFNSNVYYAIYSYYDTGAATFTGNSVQNTGGAGYYGFYIYEDANVTASNNTISGVGANSTSTALYVYDSYESTNITGNTLSLAEYGLYTYYCDNVNVSNNVVSNIGYDGMYLYYDHGFEKVLTNSLSNCGLYGGAAAIYVLDPQVVPTLTRNAYKASSNTNLSYFIDVTTGSANLSGNKTNTTLPTYP